jgi:Peptidase family M48
VSRLGKTLDIAGGATRDGAAVQIYDINGDSNQRFTFRRTSGSGDGSSGNASPNQATGAVSPNLGAGRTELKPGWNMFSPEQDVELGQQAALEVTQQVQMLNDSRVDNYLNTLGQRLSAKAPGFKYPYTYKAVNDSAINAFALPGGNIFINRGVIEAADNEAQLAGVMAHETAHVALRHGTNQASKASAAQLPLAILGGLLGNDSTGAALAQLGAGFTVNSVLLKYSRDAESQADLMGTQMLSDAGYDPRAMGQFFQKIEAQNPGGNGPAFFLSHPNPDRRIENVNEEVARLGSRPVTLTSSKDFDQIKRRVQSLPAPRVDQSQALQGDPAPGNGASRPETASPRFVTFENSVLRIDHPDNWQTYGQADAVTIAPRGGIVNDGNGNQALAYGALVNIYEPHSDRYGQPLQGPGFGQGSGMSTEEATDQLVLDLRQSNRNMRVLRRHESIDIPGERGLSTYLSNDSPIPGGSRETNWLVTLPHPNGLLFFVFTAPEREFQNYESAFQKMLQSVRVSR